MKPRRLASGPAGRRSSRSPGLLAALLAAACSGGGGGPSSPPPPDPTVRANDAVLRTTSPRAGETGLPAQREIVLRFAGALDPATVTAAAVRVERDGVEVPTRRRLAPSGDTLSLYPVAPWPSGVRLELVVVDGGLLAISGRALDADGDGRVGGGLRAAFVVADRTRVPGTELCGRVFAAADGGAHELPLAGVTLAVDGLEGECVAVTDAAGNFCLTDTPAGDVLVHVVGNTAATPPAGSLYANVAAVWPAAAGRRTAVGTTFLPAVHENALVPTAATQPTVVRIAEEQLGQVADAALRERLRAVELVVPANGPVTDDGVRGGRVRVVPALRDRLPFLLPAGLVPPVLVEVGADGATAFEPSSTLCLPNLPDPQTQQVLPAGSKVALWGFRHDTGRAEILGTMTVAPDAITVCTDAGSGVPAPGFYGAAPGTLGVAAAGNGAAGMFFALAFPELGAGADRRGRADALGALHVVLPAQQPFTIAVVDVAGRRIGDGAGTTAATGAITDLPTPAWRAFADLPDGDGDGLPDEVERVLATDPGDADSDQDGVDDGAEVFGERDPTDGIAARERLLADAATSGPALDLAAANGLVVVACGSAGLDVFSIWQNLPPARLANVALPGQALRVAMQGHRVAVALGAAGLAIVDLATPHAPTLTVFAFGDTRAVAFTGNRVVAGTTSGRTVVVEATTSRVLAERTIGAAAADVRLQGALVNVLAPTALHVLQLAGGLLEPRFTLPLPGGGHTRLAAAPGGLMAVHGQGFVAIDTGNAVAPQIAAETWTNLAGWRHLVLDGAGDALVVAGPSVQPDAGDDLWRYRVPTLATPGVLDRVFTGDDFPDFAAGTLSAVVLHDGLVWTTDRRGRLFGSRHRPRDVQRQPPTIALVHPGGAGQVEEGTVATIVADVGDDARVASVEFTLGGTPIAGDGAWPFEVQVPVPSPNVSPMLQFGARCRDTGGNLTVAAPLQLQVVADATAPTVLRHEPEADGLALARRALVIRAVFDEAIDPATVSVGSLLCVATGPDDQFGTLDDVPVVVDSATWLPAEQAAVWTTATPLVPQRHRVDVAGVRDLAGNAMASRSFSFATQDGLQLSFFGEHDLPSVGAMFAGRTPLSVVEHRAGVAPRTRTRTVVPDVHFPFVNGNWAIHAGADGLFTTTDFTAPQGDDITWALPDSFGMLLEGRIAIPLAGNVTFQCLVDDAFALELGGAPVWDHLGCQVQTSYTSPALPLAAGPTGFRMAAADACFFGFTLTLSANGGGFAGGIVPPIVFR